MAFRKPIILLLLVIPFFTTAQIKDTSYYKEWISIDTMIIGRNMYKAALDKVNQLYKRAEKDGLPAQKIKALIYRYTLEREAIDRSHVDIIQELQKNIAKEKNISANSLLRVLLAKNLYDYYTEQRWQIYERKQTKESSPEKIDTWGITDFRNAITEQYLKALDPAKELFAIPVRQYDAVLIRGNQPSLHQTLFDLLAEEALHFFISGDLSINQPIDAFVLNQPIVLDNAANFIRTTIPTKDSSAEQWLSWKIFRQLLSLHEKDADPTLFIETDIKRIEWAHTTAILPNKDSLYTKALNHITEKYPHHAASGQAWLLLAKKLYDQAGTYQPNQDTVSRYDYVKALSLIDHALTFFDSSNRAYVPLINLRIDINRIYLSTITEFGNIPLKPFRAQIRYRNTNTVYVRILKTNTQNFPNEKEGGKNFWKSLSQLTPYKSFSQSLPASEDHQLHTTEIKIDGLPVGEYLLLCSNKAGFSDSLDFLTAQRFYVTNLSYIQNRRDFFVVNRESGMPMADVTVDLLKEVYSYELKKYQDQQITRKTTDKNGHLLFDAQESYNSRKLVLQYKGDKLVVNEYIGNYPQPIDNQTLLGDTKEEMMARINYEKQFQKVYFFTDRAIYRPGQKVYFKCIAVTRDYITKFSKIIGSKDAGWVYLRDVNQKKIDSIRFQLNEYGSFAGSFVLPSNGLTGSYSIQPNMFNRNTTYISVEAYKRPSFQVTFEKPKGSYRLNDTIYLTGTAKAFSGNSIDGAKVVYNINRKARYSYPYYRRGPIKQAGDREISNGIVTTDAEGKFSIAFKASADDIASGKEGNPVFNFVVNATVTDGNGETRTANTSISTGYTALEIVLNVPSTADAIATTDISISTVNLSNEKQAATVTLQLIPLEVPNRLLRKRLWESPDQYVLSEKEFIQYFPNDEYKEETDYLSWKQGKTLQQTIVQTATTDSWKLEKIPAGTYIIVASTTDQYGESVSTSQYLRVYDRNLQRLPALAYQFNPNEPFSLAPGDTASFTTATDASQVFVVTKTQRAGSQTDAFSYGIRKKGFSEVYFIARESDRGGALITESFVVNNRMYTTQYRIDIPWTNKQLSIDYSSYRNKTEPGSQEKWTITIKNEKNENVAAELLTGMYDASLDQFRKHNWYAPGLWDTKYWGNEFVSGQAFLTVNSQEHSPFIPYLYQNDLTGNRLASTGYELWETNLRNWEADTSKMLSPQLKKHISSSLMFFAEEGGAFSRKRTLMGKAAAVQRMSAPPGVLNEIVVASKREEKSSDENEIPKEKVNSQQANNILPPTSSNTVTIRKDFNETAFFIPQLYADSTGRYHFSFTMPEALTQWKWMSVAHTKDLAFGTGLQSIVTQKKLMVQGNAPRFLREGDKMEFSAKITNLDTADITGQVSLELLDATTNRSVDGWFQNVFPVQYFTAEAGRSTAIKFPIQIPFSYNRPLIWRLVAKSSRYSDGEENTVPVLTNRLLVTEALPILLLKDTTQSFQLTKLVNNTSESLTHEGITISYTSNPIWQAIQSLPYLMEYPYECVEQTFNRFYANALGAYIVNKDPKIKKVFEAWQKDTSALKSALQLNQELKQLMIEETPWVFEAESEAKKKQNLALLFDVFRLSTQADQLITKLQQMQLPEGAFSWFKGGYPDRYMTNYVLTGIGKLKRLGAITPDVAIRLKPVIDKALSFLDERISADFKWWREHRMDTTKTPISTSQIEYLYMRSYFRDVSVDTKHIEAYNYFYNRGKQFLNKQSTYNKAMLGLVYYRANEKRFTNVNLLFPIVEAAITDTAKAVSYWKERFTSNWYNAPIEHQSMMLLMLQEVQEPQYFQDGKELIDRARNWLLMNKQTNNWQTTVATADACYALVYTGTDLLHAEKQVTFQLGKQTYRSTDVPTEAGTGYFKQQVPGIQVKPEMGNITVTVQTKNAQLQEKGVANTPSWGAIFWQYFEDMNKITPASTPLSVVKKLYIEKNRDKGKILELLQAGDALKVGDKVVIRLELRSDREMEYLHLKDMRAAGMEPINVRSGYKWQDGLGYYESTRDASTNFFINNLQKGTYVFEYPVYITHTGVFSVGIATIQSMYAPEFTSHSSGIMIRVGE